jgi:REP element-mobilizing transposase RayT
VPEYRRIKKAGGTYFFTVVTRGRRPILTSPEVRQALREGISQVRQTMPFSIEAWVLLPDHLHAIWTLPEHDDRFAARWAVIKSCVTKRCGNLFGPGENVSISRSRRQEGGVFGSMSSAMNWIFTVIWITSIGTRLNMDTRKTRWIGLIQPSTVLWPRDSIRPIGVVAGLMSLPGIFSANNYGA